MRLYLLFMLFAAFGLQAQTCTVVSADSQKGVPYATVVFSGGDKAVGGFYTNDAGVFNLPSYAYDKAEVSCLGFETAVFTTGVPPEIKLKPKAIELNEVVVAGGMQKDTLLGEFNEKKYKNGLTIGKERNLAMFFGNDTGRELYIKELWLKPMKIKHTTVLRVHIYSRRDYVPEYYPTKGADRAVKTYDSYIPGNDLYEQNIIVTIKPEDKKLAKIDLSGYNVYLPEKGAFVSIEGLGYVDENGNAMAVVPLKEQTFIEKHLTDKTDFCDKLGVTNQFWVNINKWLSNDFESLHIKGALPPKDWLIAPTMGLLVAQ